LPGHSHRQALIEADVSFGRAITGFMQDFGVARASSALFRVNIALW
jgi:hypothetical protein